MNKKTISIVLLLSFTFIPNFSYAQRNFPRERAGTAIFVMATTPQYIIETKKLKNKEINMDLVMEYPEIRGLENKKFQKKINKKIKKNVISKQKKFKRNVPNNAQNYSEYIHTFKSHQPSDQYIVFKFFEYQYTGGESGVIDENYLTVDIKNSEILSLKNLFLPYSDYETEINSFIKNNYPDNEITAEIIESNKENAFYIDENKNLVIVYNISKKNPSNYGIIKYTIPVGSLESYIFTPNIAITSNL